MIAEGSVINTIIIRRRIQEIENIEPSRSKILLELQQCLKLYSNDKIILIKEGKIYKHYETCDISKCSCLSIDFLVEGYLVESDEILNQVRNCIIF